MISYSERVTFSPQDAEAFRLARALVGRVRSHLAYDGQEIRCHELARAVVRVLTARGLEAVVVDGSLWLIEHTWILLPGQGDQKLLDVYAPGRLPQVQLLDVHPSVTRGYRASPAHRDDVRDRVVDDLVAAWSDMPALSGPIVDEELSP